MAEAIIIKSPSDIEHMRRAGKIASEARSIGRQAVAAGVSTREIDREIHDFITKSGAIPTFLGYGGFPASACISVNEEIIHGIPGKRKIKDGDIVSIDVGATFEGFVGDCAGTFYCGEISQEAQNLINVTRQSFFEAVKYARVGYRISDIGAAVQEYAESHRSWLLCRPGICRTWSGKRDASGTGSTELRTTRPRSPACCRNDHCH